MPSIKSSTSPSPIQRPSGRDPRLSSRRGSTIGQSRANPRSDFSFLAPIGSWMHRASHLVLMVAVYVLIADQMRDVDEQAVTAWFPLLGRAFINTLPHLVWIMVMWWGASILMRRSKTPQTHGSEDGPSSNWLIDLALGVASRVASTVLMIAVPLVVGFLFVGLWNKHNSSDIPGNRNAFSPSVETLDAFPLWEEHPNWVFTTISLGMREFYAYDLSQRVADLRADTYTNPDLLSEGEALLSRLNRLNITQWREESKELGDQVRDFERRHMTWFNVDRRQVVIAQIQREATATSRLVSPVSTDQAPTQEEATALPAPVTQASSAQVFLSLYQTLPLSDRFAIYAWAVGNNHSTRLADIQILQAHVRYLMTEVDHASSRGQLSSEQTVQLRAQLEELLSLVPMTPNSAMPVEAHERLTTLARAVNEATDWPSLVSPVIIDDNNVFFLGDLEPMFPYLQDGDFLVAMLKQGRATGSLAPNHWRGVWLAFNAGIRSDLTYSLSEQQMVSRFAEVLGSVNRHHNPSPRGRRYEIVNRVPNLDRNEVVYNVQGFVERMQAQNPGTVRP